MYENPWHRLPPGYTAKYAECEGGVYWKLAWRGEHINGGIQDSWDMAQDSAARYARQHETNRGVERIDTFDLEVALALMRHRPLGGVRG